jgi:hypothetical protein
MWIILLIQEKVWKSLLYTSSNLLSPPVASPWTVLLASYFWDRSSQDDVCRLWNTANQKPPFAAAYPTSPMLLKLVLPLARLIPSTPQWRTLPH